MKTDKPSGADFFTADVSAAYDARNAALAPIADNLHFLTALVLQGLPRDARILCVGVGTGAEILSLAARYPAWRFVGVDPSQPMLDVCRDRLRAAGILDRCTLIHGYAQDIAPEEKFDAVLSILVAHFVPRVERPDFYRQMLDRLKEGGYFVSAEISFDLQSATFSPMLDNWARVQELMGAGPAQIEALPEMLRDMLCILSPSETEDFLRAAGIAVPVRFFQAFMIGGWYGQKSGPI